MVPGFGLVLVSLSDGLGPLPEKDLLVGVEGWEEGGVGSESSLCDRCGTILLAGTEIGGSSENVTGTGPTAFTRSVSHVP